MLAATGELRSVTTFIVGIFCFDLPVQLSAVARLCSAPLCVARCCLLSDVLCDVWGVIELLRLAIGCVLAVVWLICGLEQVGSVLPNAALLHPM